MISNMLVSPSAWPVLRLPGWRRSVTDQSGSCSRSVIGTGLRAVRIASQDDDRAEVPGLDGCFQQTHTRTSSASLSGYSFSVI
jgi:hypothetical protein